MTWRDSCGKGVSNRARATGWGKLSNTEVKLDGADALAIRLLQPSPLVEGSGLAGPAPTACRHAGSRRFGELRGGARLRTAAIAPDRGLSAGARSTTGAHL